VISFDEARAKLGKALASRAPREISAEGFARAAVLVPILRRREGPTVLLTQRTESVTQHKGQISFPGGRCETGESTRAAALREAQEEVGLDPARVEILGALDDMPSVSSYMVTPWVGLVSDPPETHTAQVSEVLESFEVPLATILDPKSMRTERWDATMLPADAPVTAIMKLRADWEDLDPVTQTYLVYFFDTPGNRVVWGLTGRILKQLLDALT
jgi:8-oxo-dGTP pyrophosphatase MutT (NUDIX family)